MNSVHKGSDMSLLNIPTTTTIIHTSRLQQLAQIILGGLPRYGDIIAPS